MKKMLVGLVTIALLQGCSSTLLMSKEDVALRDRVMSTMVFVEGGSYLMGERCEQSANACPQQNVSIGSFSISKFEMTQDIFAEVIDSDISYFRGDNMPVNHITWQQVHYFIAQLNARTGKTFRLPTEAEWEFAAKGGNKTQGFTYAGSNDIKTVGWYDNNAKNRAYPVGSKQANELGLYDMTGNVGEWVQDAYEAGYDYFQSLDNPVYDVDSNHHLSYKAVRGGGFSYSQTESTNTSRDFASQTARMADIGFRLVLSN